MGKFKITDIILHSQKINEMMQDVKKKLILIFTITGMLSLCPQLRPLNTMYHCT